MSGINIPEDRTTLQPAMGYCSNPECREDNREFRFIVEHDHIACPKCGQQDYPKVGPLVLIHWITPDDSGPIQGKQGKRFKLACHQERAYLATATNLEAATDQPKLVTCRQCLEAANKSGGKLEKQVAKNQHRKLLIGD